MKNDFSNQGMTLVEIMIAMSIIGLVLVVLVPTINKAVERRQNAITASHMRIAVNAFELCKGETGNYPEDVSRGVVPPEMTDYFETLGILKKDADGNVVENWWSDENELGARWDWDKNNNFAYSVSFVDPRSSVSEKQLVEFDALVDDGNLETGNLRRVGTRYHYILEE
jgi:prepilin-type N-terminal cleavage/methylation domain-containing protein